MKKYLINKKSDRLLIFFTGWGCDEYEFEHLKSVSDVLILYDYCDLSLDFDFSKYNKFDLLAFSAGVFVASVMKFDFKIDKRVAINGNPYLFDEKLGLSKKMQNILYNITEETAEDFGRNYLVKTDKEWVNFHPSRRTLESCKTEFECLKQIYVQNYQKIEDIFDTAFVGEDDRIFDVEIQKEFYGNKLKIVKNARHNLFFRVKSYEEFLI
ncbi:DUF452 family protein [bacterium]|nr:DUF452 family protein [bacterium]